MRRLLAVFPLSLLLTACGPDTVTDSGPDDLAGDGDGDGDAELEGDGDGDGLEPDMPSETGDGDGDGDEMPIPDMGSAEEETGDGDGDGDGPLHCCNCDGVWCPCDVPMSEWCEQVDAGYPAQCIEACGEG